MDHLEYNEQRLVDELERWLLAVAVLPSDMTTLIAIPSNKLKPILIAFLPVVLASNFEVRWSRPVNHSEINLKVADYLLGFAGRAIIAL